MSPTVQTYVDAAVRFRPAAGGSLRVAATLLPCRVAADLLNDMGLPPEPPSGYRFVNVHNPVQPLRFDLEHRRWCCDPAFDTRPVTGLNWPCAQRICKHLGARLPTVQEWEAFASNNDPRRRYPWGDAPPSPALANYDEHYGGTTDVRQFPPSELGLYDLAGNLSEWCADTPSDIAAGMSMERMVKGGAWSKDACFLAIAVSRLKWGRLGTTTIGLRPVWDDGAAIREERCQSSW
jgi:formylglycine-generating enzyme required for sulfatase activity